MTRVLPIVMLVAALTPLHAQTADTTPPDVSLLGLPSGATVGGLRSVQWTVQDPGGIASSTVAVDGTALAARLVTATGSTTPLERDTSISYQATWDTTLQADGVHTLVVTATDAAGNVATLTRAISVSNAPPVIPAPIVNIAAPDIRPLPYFSGAGAGQYPIVPAVDGHRIRAAITAYVTADTALRIIAGSGPYCGTGRVDLTAAYPMAANGPALTVTVVAPSGLALCTSTSTSTSVRGAGAYEVLP